MSHLRSIALTFQAVMVLSLIPAAAALVRWAENDLIDACAVAALGAGFALAAWDFLDRRSWGLWRVGDARFADDVQLFDRSRQGIAVALIAWGSALPLLDLWWANRSKTTMAVVGGAGAIVIAEYLWVRGMRRRAEQGRDWRQHQRQTAPPATASRPPRRWAWFVVGLLLLTLVAGVALGFSTWVGFHVGGDGFDWELSAVVGTAVGTSLLALVTGGLALVTAADVNASREIARTAREEQETRSRPILLVESVQLTVMGQGDTDVELVLRNGGLGVAVRGALQIRYVAGVTTLVEAMIYATSLTSGETKTITARVTPSQPIPQNWRHVDWSISGVFLDAAGQPHTVIDGQPDAPDRRVTIVDPPGNLAL